MAREGAKVVTASFNGCEETAKLIREAGREALDVVTVVSDGKSVEKIADDTLKQGGRIDILVNNAGYYCKL
jgi:NAD(P)-dependent dehydrogenase (short-subunit alcohol dehydrogenase family)